MEQVVKNAVKVVEIEISQVEMVERLKNIKGTTFVQLYSTTEPKMNKRGNCLFNKVVKDSITNCIVGYNYENMVNNARRRELNADVKEACISAGVPADVINQFENEVGQIVEKSVKDFEAKNRQWGSHMIIGFESKIVDGTPTNIPIYSRILIEHVKDNEYRVYIQVAVLNAKTPVYRYKKNNEELTDNDIEYIKGFMPEKTEGERQELKNPIIVRDYRIDNVKRIQLNKTMYIIK